MNKFEDFFKDFNNQKIVFKNKPIRYNPTMALEWRIGVLLIFFKYCCSSGRAPLQKIQLFYSHMSSENKLKSLISALAGESDIYSSDVSLDPTLLRVLNFMLSYTFLTKEKNGRFCLTEKGSDSATIIFEDSESFASIKKIIFSLKKNDYSDKNFLRVLKGANK